MKPVGAELLWRRRIIDDVRGLRLLLVLAAWGWPLPAADKLLSNLKSTLEAMRGLAPGSGGPRGAAAPLTIAKHLLRDWVESRIAAAKLDRGVETEFVLRLNAELGKTGLLCSLKYPAHPPCPAESYLGYVQPVKLLRKGGFLILQTGVGILCGFDESAYLYSWSREGWHRVWQSEQLDYTEGKYKPQTIVDVLISPYNRLNNYVVVTLGENPWCTSNWHQAYYRAYRLGPYLDAQPVLEGSELSFVGNLHGSVSLEDVLIEFVAPSIDGDRLTRTAVRHYQLHTEDVRRVHPIALGPRDFVEEWLTHPWKEAVHWTEPAERAALRAKHQVLHKTHVSGHFAAPTFQCRIEADEWQVSAGLDSNPAGGEARLLYFLIRWTPPYRFSMAGISEEPSLGCDKEDPEVDQPRTLFPPQ